MSLLSGTGCEDAGSDAALPGAPEVCAAALLEPGLWLHGGEGREQARGRLLGACVLAVGGGGGHALCPSAPLLKASGSVQCPVRWTSVIS